MNPSLPSPADKPRPRTLIEATVGTDDDGRRFFKCCSDYQLALIISVLVAGGGVVVYVVSQVLGRFHS